MTKRLIIFGLFAACMASAQQTEPDTTVVITEGERHVKSSNKMGFSPEVVDTVVPVSQIDYPQLSKTTDVIISLEEIEAARLRIVEPISKLYHGYVKGGIGMYASPYFDGYFTETRSRAGQWGVNYKHFSSRDAHKDLPFSGFAENSLDLWGKRFINYHILGGYIDTDLDYRHFFGSDSLDLSKEQIQQRFTNIGFGANWNSNHLDTNRLNYKLNLDYYHYRDLNHPDTLKFDQGIEHNIKISSDMHKYFENNLIFLETSLDFNHYNAFNRYGCAECDEERKTDVYNNAVLKINPYLLTFKGPFSLRFGGGVDINIPNMETGNGQFVFYPDVEGSIGMFDKSINIYAGANGGIKRNSFRNLTRENPFILSSVKLLNKRENINVYGGLRGRFSSKMAFNLYGQFSKIENYALFVQDTTYSYNNRFDVVYDTLQISKLGAQLTYDDKKLRVNLSGDYFLYGDNSYGYHWNLPDYKFMLSTMYNLEDKIMVNLDVFVEGGRTAAGYVQNQDYGITPETIEGYQAINTGVFTDVNLGVEYRYTNRLSGFVNFNNILSQKYQRWYNYPNQGINILGGISYSF